MRLAIKNVEAFSGPVEAHICVCHGEGRAGTRRAAGRGVQPREVGRSRGTKIHDPQTRMLTHSERQVKLERFHMHYHVEGRLEP